MSTPPGAVVVGYDGSADSDLALSWADEYARDRKRPLHVVISEADSAVMLELTTDWHASRVAEIESDARDRLSTALAPETSLEVAGSPPAHALIAASSDAELVVVGARGHGLLSGILAGSVSQHVARHAVCPVVVARQPNDPASRRVVVGVDGSAASRAALEFGFDHADRTGGSLVAIYAWRSSPRASHGPVHAALGPGSSSLADEMREAERVLAEATSGMAERYPDVRLMTEAIPVSPVRALADASLAASLVAVGAHGKGAFTGLLLGSISQSLLTHARCSVAVVR